MNVPLPQLRAARAVVAVEGESDRVALETLAARLGRDLAREGVAVVVLGGVHALGRFLVQLEPRRGHMVLAGLCDAGEERDVVRALARAGYGIAATRDELAALGFHVCEADLEDELIRALGVEAVEQVLAAEGELGLFRILQQQPAQRGRPVQAQLRRFFGTRSGRKKHYARVLVEALDLARVPRPLAGVLAQTDP